jgi:anti-sigma regulatory factor (Ser/Thr protein kinase)
MKRIVVKAETERLTDVLGFVESTLAASGCPEKARLQLALAAEEAFVNIASYAYGDEGGEVDVSLSISGNPPSATLTFTDAGIPHDPLATPDPDTTLSAERRKIGGLGIYLMRRNVDDAQYRYENGYNVLTLVKAIGEVEAGENGRERSTGNCL